MFKIGSFVRITDKNTHYPKDIGKVGIILNNKVTEYLMPYYLDIKDAAVNYYFQRELEILPIRQVKITF